MTQKKQVYKCDICGNIVEVLTPGGGELVCCGQPMQLQVEKTEDDGQEKHLPVIEQSEAGTKVKVGDVAHPMEEEHFIEWIEVEIHGKICKKYLKPGDAPEVQFNEKLEVGKIRSYCNVHGLWESA